MKLEQSILKKQTSLVKTHKEHPHIQNKQIGKHEKEVHQP